MAIDKEKRKASQQAYRLRHKERVLARRRRYQESHRDQISATTKRWREEHKDQVKAYKDAYNKAYYQKRREELKAWQKNYYEAHKSEVSAWGKRYHAEQVQSNLAKLREQWRKSSAKYRDIHQEKRKEIDARRKAVKRGLGHEKIDFKAILFASKGICGICRQPFDLFGIEFDHIVPLSRGGTHTTANIQATHRRCNRLKGIKPNEEIVS
jgi:5-methylcytosine-specific restriction endonuclease McrA